MRGRAASRLRTVVLAGALAGLGACQTPGQGPVVTATATQAAPGGMDGDIRRILTQGGLNTSAPGSLQTTKMPADVQQAVAALQGGEAVPVPFGGNAAGVTPVGVQSLPQSSASSIAMLPTATATTPGNALALAPVQAAQSPFPVGGAQPPLLAALAQTQAAHARTAARRAAPAPRFALAPAPAKAAPHPTLLALAPAATPAVAAIPVAPVAMAPVAPPPPVEAPPPRRF